MRLAPSSVRGRLALLFAVGSGAVLVASAGFLYVNFAGEVDGAVTEGLRARADDLASLVAEQAPAVPEGEPYGQVVAPSGEVIASSATVPGGRAVLTNDERLRAEVSEVILWRASAGLGRRSALLARPVTAADGRVVVVVVGTSLDTVGRAQDRLVLALVVVSPLLVAILAGSGWVLCSAALRPVRRMTERAAEFSATDAHQRLPVPDSGDEIAQLGITLNGMLDRIQAATAHERAFVDDASHELRTPISILRTEIELALRNPGDRAEVEAALRSALEEAERVSRLAEDLLVLARAAAGALPLRRQAVGLREAAETAAARAGAIGGPDITVEGEEAMADADPERVEQVLTNLIDNARRHATSKVCLVVTNRGDEVELVVADDGPGFALQVEGSAFDRFTRGDATRRRNTGGAGLGLAIVETIVKGHGGSVTAGGGPPLGGATVTVRLPASLSSPSHRASDKVEA